MNNWGPNKSFEKKQVGTTVIWDRREPSCLYNHHSVVRLIIYRSSIQEVFLQKRYPEKI